MPVILLTIDIKGARRGHMSSALVFPKTHGYDAVQEKAAESRADPALQAVVRTADEDMASSAMHIIVTNTGLLAGRVGALCSMLRLRTFEDLAHMPEKLDAVTEKFELTPNERARLVDFSKICRTRDSYLNFCVRAHRKKLRDACIQRDRQASAPASTHSLQALLSSLRLGMTADMKREDLHSYSSTHHQ
jgi:hypothetical protein